MSASFGNQNSSQEVELNITPIIDCFTVLITFMLASASFLSIGFLEVSTPGSAASSSEIEPDTEVVIRLHAHQKAEIKIKGKKNLQLTLDLNQAENKATLKHQLQLLEQEKVNLGQILLTADDEVDFNDINLIMGELNQQKYPVMLGEF